MEFLKVLEQLINNKKEKLAINYLRNLVPILK